MAQLDYSNFNIEESQLHFPFYHKPEYLINFARMGSKWPDLSLPAFDLADALKPAHYRNTDSEPLLQKLVSLFQITRLAYEQSQHLQATIRPLIPHSTWAEATQIAQRSNRTFPSETRNVSVLRLDIVNFTTLMDSHPLDQLLTDLNAYLDLLTQIIYEHGGDVNKYLGDGFLSIFTSADAAVQAGCAIQQAVNDFNRKQSGRGGLVFTCRIGIDSGLVVLTTIGSPERQDRTVMGMPVNLAERLQSHARPGSVWLSQETFNRFSDQSSCCCVGPIRVKGRQKPIIVYEKRVLIEEKGTTKMNTPKLLLHVVSFVLATLLLIGCTGVSTEVAATLTSVPPTNTVTPTNTPTSTPTATPTPIPPTATPTPPPLVGGDWEATIAFNIGDEVNIVNFSFTINEDGNQITGFGIADLGLGQVSSGTTSAAIVDGTFTMNADTFVGTTKIGRTFKGAFIEPDKVEGTFVFDYSRLGIYEGEWVGAPEPEE